VAIQESEVQVGAFFMTSTDQLRKVTKLDKDEQERDRVHYLSKSGKIANRAFGFGHSISSPPLLPTFINDSGRLLSDDDIAKLRSANIILKDE